MQVSARLRRAAGAYIHWCPGCGEAHGLPDAWTFNGNVESPTFAPSLLHRGLKRVFAGGKWTGEWERDAGNTVDFVCHYFLTDGQLHFCGDSTHAMAGMTVTLPPLPGWLMDDAR